jgi:hypothetical protein
VALGELDQRRDQKRLVLHQTQHLRTPKRNDFMKACEQRIHASFGHFHNDTNPHCRIERSGSLVRLIKGRPAPA